MSHTKGPYSIKNHCSTISILAPEYDLLEALKQATDQLEADYVPTPLDGHGALIRKLRAAIAKATGKSQETKASAIPVDEL